MQDNIPDALVAAFERQYEADWNNPQLRSERLAMRYGWAAAMESKQCLHQIQEPAAAPVVLPIMPKGESAAAQLRAMATNYPPGHSWDKLDAKACIRGVLEIEALRALLATGGQGQEELPQAEGADYFVILDPEDGTVEFAYSADLGRDFGHEHIKDAQERDNESAHCWVVRPAYAAPQQADARDAESDYQRGYRHGYNRRDAEVQGALL